MTVDEQLEAVKKQLTEALEILKEVQPYRSIFFKQRVAKWQTENEKILNVSPLIKPKQTGCTKEQDDYYWEQKSQPYH